jgi:uncharacterized protein
MNKVIYHGGCSDGWCAAWIAAHALGIGEENLIRASYGSKLPYEQLRPEDEVWLVDFSYPREQLLELATLVARVVVLDHHKTAQAELADLHGCDLGIEVVFDMNRSGARIVYDEMLVKCRELGSPALQIRSSWMQVFDIVSRYVQDRDLWQWKLHLSREVSAYLASLPFTLEGWNMLFHTDWTDVERGGLAIQRYVERKTEELVRPSRYMLADIGAFKDIALTNICVGAPGSEVLDVLCKDRPFAVGWSQNGDGTFYYSLRSNGSDTDVGAFARSMRDRGTAFAGGGHAKAAGFSTRYRPDELFHNMREVPK